MSSRGRHGSSLLPCLPHSRRAARNRHDPGDTDPLVFPGASYDWGAMNEGAVNLAIDLLVDATDGAGHSVSPLSLARLLLATLPRGGWTIPCNDIREWLDRRLASGEECPF